MGFNNRLLIPPTSAPVNPNLKMFLDANDTNSYNGTGTTWFDLTSNANNGAISSTAFSSGTSPKYFDFNGFSSHVNIASSSTSPFNTTSRQFTLSIWFNKDSNSFSPLMAKYGTTNASRSWYLSSNGDNKLSMLWWSGTTSQYQLSSNAVFPSTGVWYNAVFAVGSSINSMYVNGVLTDAISGALSLVTGNNEPIVIGSQAGGQYNFLNGQIGQAKIYDDTLTAAQVLADFNANKATYGL